MIYIINHATNSKDSSNFINVIKLSDYCRQIVILRSEATKNFILQAMGFFTPVGRSE
ncbi:MAG: hypothetical protein Q6358_00130 [Candidatus Brocadiales bacterium]|nr:hypothetical protein [Candidatus Brocadiales bacterium]